MKSESALLSAYYALVEWDVAVLAPQDELVFYVVEVLDQALGCGHFRNEKVRLRVEPTLSQDLELNRRVGVRRLDSLKLCRFVVMQVTVLRQSMNLNAILRLSTQVLHKECLDPIFCLIIVYLGLPAWQLHLQNIQVDLSATNLISLAFQKLSELILLHLNICSMNAAHILDEEVSGLAQVAHD